MSPPRPCACVDYIIFLLVYNVFGQRRSSISAARQKILIQCGPFSTPFPGVPLVLCFAASMCLCCRTIWRALESLFVFSSRGMSFAPVSVYLRCAGISRWDGATVAPCASLPDPVRVVYIPFLSIYNVFSQRCSSILADREKILIQCGRAVFNFLLPVRLARTPGTLGLFSYFVLQPACVYAVG